MKKYDFVFVYEVKNRELENICLIRYELERRGYCVKFVETWDQELHKTRPPRAEVTVAFALYHDDTVKYISSMVSGCSKIVNLQWEQVGQNGTKSNARESGKASCSYGVSGKAKEAVHISWGEDNYHTLTVYYGLAPDHACITGHVGLDFLRPELLGYYQPRRKLLRQYGIVSGKKICLFISSLEFASFPVSELQDNPVYKDIGFDVREYVEISKKTQAIIIEWFKKALAQRDDCVFIYRPHPAERISELLKDTASSCDNFYIIGDLSVKQWILASDNIYSWVSTAVVEVFAANKPCSILRPVPISNAAEPMVLNNAQFITDYNAFTKTLNQQPAQFPVPESDIRKYYDIDETKASYLRVCDLLEAVYKEDSYCMDLPANTSSFMKRLRFNFRNWMRQQIVRSDTIAKSEFGRKLFLWKYPRKQGEYSQIIDTYRYYIQMRKKNHLSKSECASIVRRIRKTLQSNSYGTNI